MVSNSLFLAENQHKKVAFNRGVREARGELFWLLTPTTGFPPNALETFAEHWRLIPGGEREQFAGVCGLCVYENGRVVGDRFPGATQSTGSDIAIESGREVGIC